MTSAGRDRVARALGELYPGRVPELLSRVEALVAAHAVPARGAIGGKAEPGFSSRDAILISYADMLRREGSRPLELLADFAERRIAGPFNRIHVLPFYPSSSDEGYSVMDYRSVDPRFGGWEDVERIGRSLGLSFDLVLNHASSRGDWFRLFLEGREPFDRFFITRPRGFDGSKVFRPRTHPLLTPFVRADGKEILAWTTFSADQVDLDFSEPEVLLAMAETALLYVAKGASMLRLDAVAFAWKEDGTDCLDRPQVHSILRFLRTLLDEASPGVSLLSETNLPREINDSYFGDGDEAHLVYNFPLPPLALHAFVAGRAGYLASWAADLPAPRPDRRYVNFLASHDGIGVTPARGLLPDGEIDALVSAVRARGGLVSDRSTPEGPVPYELNTTVLDAIAEPEAPDDGRVRAFLACHAAMAALSGVPAVWFHSLVGSRNWMEGPAATGSKRSINRERLDAARLERELADPESMRSRAYAGIRVLLEARSARRAFDPASPQRVLSPEGSGRALRGRSAGNRDAAALEADGPLFGLLRGGGAETVLALVNVSAAEASCELPRAFEPSGDPFDPTGGMGGGLSGRRAIVPPKGSLWIDGRMEDD